MICPSLYELMLTDEGERLEGWEIVADEIVGLMRLIKE